MRVIKLLAPAFVAGSLLSGCVDGPVSSHGGGAIALSLAPEFSFASSARSLPIESVLTTPFFASDFAAAGEPYPNPVESDDAEWTVFASVDLGGRDTATIVVEVELKSSGGVVEWSGLVGPVFVRADETPSEVRQEVTLYRGPLENAGVESLAVAGPSLLFIGTSVQAHADVVSLNGHTVIWSSSDAQVASVTSEGSGDDAFVHAHEVGSAWIRAEAGLHADSFLVTVDSASTAEPAFVEALPDSAIVIAGATRAWYAYATDSAGVPIAATVSWQSLDQAVATVSSSGVVAGVSVGRARIVASAGEAADTVIAIVEDLPAGVDVLWQGGTPGAETDWFTADNWSPSRVPTASDVAYFPDGALPMYLDANAEVGGLLGDSAGFSVVELLENVTLTVNGDVLIGYLYGDSTSVVEMTGPGALWAWYMPSLVVRGQVAVSTEAYVYGDVRIENGGTLDVGVDAYLYADGDLTVVGAGLGMSEDSATGYDSYVTVLGDVLFDGGDSNGRLTGGYLGVSGDFTVTATSCTAFRPTGLEVELYSDTTTISMGCAGTAGNRFWDVWIYGTGAAPHVVELQSDLVAAREFYLAWDNTTPTTVAGNGYTVAMQLGSVGPSTFDHAFIRVDNAEIDDYFWADSLVFTGMAGETRPQLLVNSMPDECTTCSEWQHIVFDPTSSGPYIELNDVQIDGDSIIYYMAANPGDGPQRTVVTGEAAVYWADVPYMLTEWAGYSQTGAAGQPLPDSLVVFVGDYYGDPVAGVTIGWTVTDSDGAVSPATGVSDAAGLVATQYTMGSVNYPVQEVIATAAAVADTAYFYEYESGGALSTAGISGPIAPQRSVRMLPLDIRDREPRPVRVPPARPYDGTLDKGDRR